MNITITKSQFLLIFIVVLNVFMVDISSDIFSPAIPLIQREFDTSVFISESLVGMSVIWLGLSALFYGVLSDWYGRKSATLAGLTIFLLGAIWSACSHDIANFLVGRNLQGIGSGFALAIGIAILRDMFQEEMFIKLTSIIGAILLFVPVIAPILGSYLTLYFGWRATFYLVVILSAVALTLTLFKFKETNHHLSKPTFSDLYVKIIAILSTKKYLYYVLINSCATACIWLIINFMPYMLQSQFKLPLQIYGVSLAIALLSGVVGALSNTKLIEYYSEKSILYTMTLLGVLAAIVIFIADFFPYSHIIALAGVSIYFFTAAFIFPITSDLALAEIDEHCIGIASSILTLFEMVLSGIVLLLTAHFSAFMPTFTSLTALVIIISMFISGYILWKHCA